MSPAGACPPRPGKGQPPLVTPVLMVDSAAAATEAVAVPQTLLSWTLGPPAGPPRAWGRYLTTPGGPATPLSTAEADAVWAAGIGLVPIYNLVSQESLARGWPGGVADAQDALAIAAAVGVPPGTLIGFDIEADMALEKDWVEAVAYIILAAGMWPLIYGALASPGFAPAFLAALETAPGNVGRCYLWAATPQPGLGAEGTLPAWAPDAPSPATLSMVRFWQVENGAAGGFLDLDCFDATLLAPGSPLWVPRPSG